MDADDLILVDGEGFQRRHGLLAQHLGRLDCLAGVRRHGRVFPFDIRHRPAELCLPPVAVGLYPPYRLFMAVDTLPAQIQQRARSLDGLQRALLQALHSLAQRLPALIEFPLPFIDLLLALVQRGLPPVSLPFPLISHALALVSFAFALVRYALALFCRALALIGRLLALIRRALALSHGLTLSRPPIPRLGGCLPVCHTPRMHRFSPGSPLPVEVLGTMTETRPALASCHSR